MSGSAYVTTKNNINHKHVIQEIAPQNNDTCTEVSYSPAEETNGNGGHKNA